MKANELMIGDWVYNKHHGKNIRLTQYDFFTHTHNDFGEQELAPFAKPTIGRDLEPIPLTPEILEKNGFRITFEGELHTTYFRDIENYHTEVKIGKDGTYQKLSMLDGFGNSVTIIACNFVHELQHALRLCKIKKEIKL
jgi:hypothetical protein